MFFVFWRPSDVQRFVMLSCSRTFLTETCIICSCVALSLSFFSPNVERSCCCTAVSNRILSCVCLSKSETLKSGRKLTAEEEEVLAPAHMHYLEPLPTVSSD